MTHPGPQPYPPAPGYPPPGWQPPKQKNRKWPWVLVGIFAFLILLVSIGGKNQSTTAGQSAATLPAPTPTVQQQPADATQAAAQPAQQSGPMTTFRDVETLEVGTDIASGQYTTDGAPGGFLKNNCYYEIHKAASGTFSDLIKNGNVGEGTKGRVSLKSGQYFSSSGGCAWTKAD